MRTDILRSFSLFHILTIHNRYIHVLDIGTEQKKKLDPIGTKTFKIFRTKFDNGTFIYNK